MSTCCAFCKLCHVTGGSRRVKGKWGRSRSARRADEGRQSRYRSSRARSVRTFWRVPRGPVTVMTRALTATVTPSLYTRNKQPGGQGQPAVPVSLRREEVGRTGSREPLPCKPASSIAPEPKGIGGRSGRELRRVGRREGERGKRKKVSTRSDESSRRIQLLLVVRRRLEGRIGRQEEEGDEERGLSRASLVLAAKGQQFASLILNAAVRASCSSLYTLLVP